MKRMSWTLAAALLTVAGANAESTEFDFADPKGVNGIHLQLDTTLEPIAGIAGGVSGKVTFDPAAPEKTTGYVEVQAGEIAFVSPMMTKVAVRRDRWAVLRHPGPQGGGVVGHDAGDPKGREFSGAERVVDGPRVHLETPRGGRRQ